MAAPAGGSSAAQPAPDPDSDPEVFILSGGINKRMFDYLYQRPPRISNYCLQALGIPDFRDATIEMESTAVAWAYACMRVAVEAPDRKLSKVKASLVVGELMALCAEDRCITGQDHARRYFCNTIIMYLNKGQEHINRHRVDNFDLEAGRLLRDSRIMAGKAIHAGAVQGVGKAAVPVTLPNPYEDLAAFKTIAHNDFPDAVIAENANVTEDFFASMLGILYFFAGGLNLKSKSLYYSTLLEGFLSYTQMASITPIKIRKLNRDFSAELQSDVSLNMDHVKQIYLDFHTEINEARVVELIRRLQTIIPQDALQVRLCLDKCMWHRLTSLNTIRRAITGVPQFPWNLLLSHGPYFSEYRAFQAAYNLVHSRPYAGYEPNLQVTAAANYRKLATVCAVICNRILGDHIMTSMNPMAFTTAFPNKNQIMSWISEITMVNVDQSPEHLRNRVPYIAGDRIVPSNDLGLHNANNA